MSRPQTTNYTMLETLPPWIVDLLVDEYGIKDKNDKKFKKLYEKIKELSIVEHEDIDIDDNSISYNACVFNDLMKNILSSGDKINSNIQTDSSENNDLPIDFSSDCSNFLFSFDDISATSPIIFFKSLNSETSLSETTTPSSFLKLLSSSEQTDYEQLKNRIVEVLSKNNPSICELKASAISVGIPSKLKKAELIDKLKIFLKNYQ